MGKDWLNVLFLADVKYNDKNLEISYMKAEELNEKIAELETMLRPTSAREVFTLWVRGQQVRSGALQYMALSDELRQKAMPKILQQLWVTGGSSPSLGEAGVVLVKELDDNTFVSTLNYYEMLQGEVYSEIRQKITLSKEVDNGTTYWVITNVENNQPYYSVIPDNTEEEDKKGNPVASFYPDQIIIPLDHSVTKSADDIGNNYTAIFVNGTLVTGYDMLHKDNKILVPRDFIIQELGHDIKLEDLVNDESTITHEGISYVPLRSIAEGLNMNVVYAPRLDTPYTYYYDTKMPISPANTIIRDYPNVIIDENYDDKEVISKEKAMEQVKEACKIGLENFSITLKENLIASGESPDRLDDDFKGIEKEIDRMLYIGEISRYYKFTIGPYDLLFDKYNHKIFLQIYSSGTTVKELDVDDPGLFIPVFIVG